MVRHEVFPGAGEVQSRQNQASVVVSESEGEDEDEEDPYDSLVLAQG